MTALRTTAAAAVAALLVTGLGACGSKSDDDSGHAPFNGDSSSASASAFMPLRM